MLGRIIDVCGIRGTLDGSPAGAELPRRSVLHTEVRADHNLAVITVEIPGADLVAEVGKVRSVLFGRGLDALYVDLPLDRPETEEAGEDLEDLGVSFAGLFPNTRVLGDVLRMQILNDVTISIDDISTASDHGRDLLAYVVADLDS
jgi:hypothetical protein